MEETLASSMDVESSPGAENVMFHTATILAATAPTTRAFDDEPPLFASSSLTLESRSLLERNPPPPLPILRRSERLKMRERGENEKESFAVESITHAELLTV